MEGLLCGAQVFDLTAPVVFFPIRHHSPACSFHLERIIAAYQPDCILVEGPENANHLIPVLTDPDTKAPVALYYSYRDSKGLVSEDKEDYKCYYPLLDYSPELVALRQAKALGIPVRFIDLPYAQMLIGSNYDRQTYNDDYLLSRSAYITRLCEKTGLRDFEEFWEKYFEIQGLEMDSEVFVSQMLTHCYLTREQTPDGEMEADGCLIREQFMAQRIREAGEQYPRVLAVTGGFHTSGLKTLLADHDAVKNYVPVSIEAKDQGVYPMAYSMEATDALNGYASGMQSPGFYQTVWAAIGKGMERELAGEYEAAVLRYLTAAGKQARREGEAVTAYDEICAFSMSRNLAALRGKREAGLYELKDSVLSSFVKGECNLSTDKPLRILRKLITGKAVGVLCATADRPPLLRDFEMLCRKYGLQIHTSVEQELMLDIFTKEKHRQMSRFFYRMEFMKTSFAVREKGPDLLNRRDRSRIREQWKYRWTGQVVSTLIDISVSGGTVQEAAMSLWHKGFEAADTCQEAAGLMVRGFLMGLADEQEQVRQHMEMVLAQDGDFFSLANGFSHLAMLLELKDLYQVSAGLHLEELVNGCFQKVIQLLPLMAQVQGEQVKESMKICLTLYQTTGKPAFGEFRPLLIEGFQSLLRAADVRASLEGAVIGLLYGYDRSYAAAIQETFAGYASGTPEQVKKASGFLKGLFYTARDFVFASQAFLVMIDELLGRLSGDEFMELLPELRMAFGYFTPMETNRIAGKAAGLHHKSGRELMQSRIITPAQYEYGEQLDAHALRQMEGGRA